MSFLEYGGDITPLYLHVDPLRFHWATDLSFFGHRARVGAYAMAVFLWYTGLVWYGMAQAEGASETGREVFRVGTSVRIYQGILRTC